VDPHDTAADPASFGIPTYVIADFEFLCHVSILTLLIKDRNRHTSDFHVAPIQIAEASLFFPD
jgi:hypothetical protein